MGTKIKSGFHAEWRNLKNTDTTCGDCDHYTPLERDGFCGLFAERYGLKPPIPPDVLPCRKLRIEGVDHA